MGTRTYIHHTLQVVDINLVQHVGLAEAQVGGSKHLHVKGIAVDGDPDGAPTLLTRSEAMDAL